MLLPAVLRDVLADALSITQGSGFDGLCRRAGIVGWRVEDPRRSQAVGRLADMWSIPCTAYEVRCVQ